MQSSLNTKCRFLCAAFLILALAGASAVYYGLQLMAADGRVVNQAGIVRGATQRLVKQELAGKPGDVLLAKLDGTLKGLLQGDAGLGLPPATDPAFRSAMKLVESDWQGLRDLVLKHRVQPTLRDTLLTTSEAYFDRCNVSGRRTTSVRRSG